MANRTEAGRFDRECKAATRGDAALGEGAVSFAAGDVDVGVDTQFTEVEALNEAFEFAGADRSSDSLFSG